MSIEDQWTTGSTSLTVLEDLTAGASVRGLMASRVASVESVQKLCDEVHSIAMFLSMNERRRRNNFAAPVDPKFIATWPDYEDRYAQVLAGIWLSDMFPTLENEKESRRPSADIQWENADCEAREQAVAIEALVDFSYDQATDESREFPDGFPESIEEGNLAWDRLKAETGFDLRGIFRRRALIPFVLVPRHVAARHGSAEKLSLFTHLQQAHDGFVFGVPFAAVTLMRSIMDLVLRDHYGAEGKDLDERINNCRRLPKSAGKPALHRLRKLANTILHFNSKSAKLPENLESKDFEKEILSLLLVLRGLIEGVPAWRVC